MHRRYISLVRLLVHRLAKAGGKSRSGLSGAAANLRLCAATTNNISLLLSVFIQLEHVGESPQAQIQDGRLGPVLSDRFAAYLNILVILG